MPSTNSNTNLAMKLLIIAVACFFIVSGLTALFNYNSQSEFERGIEDFVAKITNNEVNRGIDITIAVIELIIGIFLILDLINLLNFNAMTAVKIVIFILWGVFIVWSDFINSSYFPPGKGEFLIWLKAFSQHLIILASLWLIAQDN